MDEFPTIFPGYFGDPFQALNLHPTARHTQTNGKKILAALFDKAAGLEIAQIYFWSRV